jgi:hypothetical protein
MKRLLIALCVTLPALPLAACADGYYGGGAYAGSAYAYNGYYDDYYGPVYDGYWGDDGAFYYRGSDHDRHFHRGDPAHFSHDGAAGGHFHTMQGSLTLSNDMHPRHFQRGDADGTRHQ